MNILNLLKSIIELISSLFKKPETQSLLKDLLWDLVKGISKIVKKNSKAT